jgi:DNA/RNA-binding protein KIN17
MPKAERGSLKDIGKRIKMKGLQKLKFYCQICEKQCRDANGFKCHISSDNHLQQMKIFSSHATQIMDQYSKTFEKNFISTLRMRHSTSKVAANTVYQEMIQDKQHVHMNATIWTTLSDFVKYLGKTGQCVVEETDRGWYITYIERDIKKLLQVEQTQRRIDAEMAAEIEYNQRMERQIRMAAVMTAASSTNNNATAISIPTKLERKYDPLDDSQNSTTSPTIQLSLRTKNNIHSKKTTTKAQMGTTTSIKKSVFDDEEEEEEDDEQNNQTHANRTDAANPYTESSLSYSNPKQRPLSPASHQYPSNNTDTKHHHPSHKDKIPAAASKTTVTMEDKHNSKDNKVNKNNSNTNDDNDNTDPPWIHPNIMVRVINESLANGKYYRQKGHVIKINEQDPYVAQVQMHTKDDDGRNDPLNNNNNRNPQAQPLIILQLDQEDLETIGPKHVQDTIRMVRGPYAGWYGTVKTFDKKKYRATVEVYSQHPKTIATIKEVPTQNQTEISQKIILTDVDYDDFSKLYES